MFAAEHWDVYPDIMCMAKALGGGVMPIGAFTATPRVWEVFVEGPYLHTSTFGGNSLAAAAALACIRVIEEDGLVGQAAQKGEMVLKRLREVADRYPEVVAEVRGRGLMIGIQLTKEGLGGFIMSEMIQAGIIVAYTLNNPKVIRIEPPLIIDHEQLDQVVSALENACAVAAEVVDDVD